MIEEQEENYRIQQQLKELKTLIPYYKLTHKTNSQYTTVTIHYPFPEPITNKLIHKSVNNITFLILLLHDHYPFQPPLLLCLTNFTCPRWDDFRDFLEEVFQGDKWWPSITLADIVVKVGGFVQKIPTINPNKIGNRKIMMPIPKILTTTYAPGLHFIHASLLDKDDSFFAKYEKVILGISWYDFVLFSEAKENNELLIMKTIIPISTIVKLQIVLTKGKKNKIANSNMVYSIEIVMKNKKKISLKLQNSIQKKGSLDESRIMTEREEPYLQIVQLLKVLSKHIETRISLKNKETKTEQKIQKVSSFLQTLASINDDIVVLYYRLKLRAQIQKKYQQQQNVEVQVNFGLKKLSSFEDAPSVNMIIEK